ncbi:3-oxoacid - b subunit [Nannochloropsis gaditana CCMP526]|uniref:3-oxoacid - b subunit n=1 Tax=Nannochloropsis gaditana (strain CCMP526) TaxID=1093141 RepID=UPI00029F7570|nr:3-oxoacid - b subunit [Nannochloropsis gaditana CCMP526]EKU20471.1 3-oxoacid - b subunit [Nannochloropsis gaditana CCMP526]|eukprot:XP_005855895.1 3-oxoacid - b subunit [Nannochloropsis gaditana CCMP526]
MEHTAKGDSKKILKSCTLPLTGPKAKGELVLTEIFPGVTVDEIRAKTDAEFREAKGGLKVVQL